MPTPAGGRKETEPAAIASPAHPSVC